MTGLLGSVSSISHGAADAVSTRPGLRGGEAEPNRRMSRRRLRARHAALKAQNDRVFRHAYELSAGLAHLSGRGDKARLRFAYDALKTTASWREERDLFDRLFEVSA
jgi:hypothetical protein